MRKRKLWRRLELLMWVVVVVVVVQWGIGNRGRDCSCGCSLRLLIRTVRSGKKKSSTVGVGLSFVGTMAVTCGSIQKWQLWGSYRGSYPSVQFKSTIQFLFHSFNLLSVCTSLLPSYKTVNPNLNPGPILLFNQT